MPRTPGSGKPKGYKAPKTIEKLEAREYVRKRITAELDPLLDSAISHAKGVQHFVLRDKAGKFEKVTKEEAALATLNDPESVYEFWTRDPNVQALNSLLDRALDKPKEQEQEIKISGELNIVERLQHARKRLKGE